MWASLPASLVTLLLLSQSATARHQKRTVTITDYKTNTVIFPEPSVITEHVHATSNSTVVVLSTMTVVPIAASSEVSAPTNVASGIFYPGATSGSGSGTGNGFPHPTGGVGGNREHNLTKTSKVPASKPSTLSFSSVLTTSYSLAPSSTPTSHTTKVPATFSSIVPKSSSTFVSVPKSSSTSTSSSAITSATAITKTPFLRGVNLGGWLVLEKWMNSEAFTGPFADAKDQYTFDSISGASSALQEHWDTFFTESDIQDLAATGLNALRIPIGYWAYNNSGGPYITGADAYLDKAITWARAANMYVWVDCHGSPGSQNGFDNSGHAGSVDWQTEANLAASIAVLETMAKKYGSMEYADVVVGLEMTNEPISYGNNQFSTTQSWAQKAYVAVKACVENPNLVVVMHDAFQGAESWVNVGTDLLNGGERTFGIDTHLYQLYTDSDNSLTQAQHIAKACSWASDLALGNTNMPTYVGEFSAATNICVHPDGTTTAGTTCSVSGCQCQSTDFDDLNEMMVMQMRMFVEAQLDVFEESASGYFMWSAKGPGGWGFLNGIQKGVVPNPVTEREFPAQCRGLGRRDVKASFGRRV